MRYCLCLQLKLCMYSTSSPKKSSPWPHLSCPKASAQWQLSAVSYLPCALVKTYLFFAVYQYQKLPFPLYFYTWIYSWMSLLLLFINTCGKKKTGPVPRRGPLNKHLNSRDAYSKLKLICISPFTGFKLTEKENENLIVNVYILRTYLTPQFPWICTKQ